MAAGKLQEVIPTRPITYENQNAINFALFAFALLCGVLLICYPTWWLLFPVIVLLSLAFGVLLIIPIGRRGHAHGHRPAELLRRPLRGGDGFCFEK